MSSLTQWEYLDLAYEKAGEKSKKNGSTPQEYDWHWEDMPDTATTVHERLNELGDDGWELVAAVSTMSSPQPRRNDPTPDRIVYYLKRPKWVSEQQSPYT